MPDVTTPGIADGQAFIDGAQTLHTDQFGRLMTELSAIAPVIGREIAGSAARNVEAPVG